MAADPDPLLLPPEICDQQGLEKRSETSETLFQLPTARIRGTITRYEDTRTRDALRAATDGEVDHPIRFFATTRVGFQPQLPPGTSPTMILPMLLPEARQNFTERLSERGLESVSRDGTERIRVKDRNRARLTRFSAVDPEVAGSRLPLECWLGVWADDAVELATCGYPRVALAEQFGLETTEPPLTRDGQTYREEFHTVLRSF